MSMNETALVMSLKNNYDIIYKYTSNCLIKTNNVTKQNYSMVRNNCIKNRKLSIKNNKILSENIKIISNNKINSSSLNIGKETINIHNQLISNNKKIISNYQSISDGNIKINKVINIIEKNNTLLNNNCKTITNKLNFPTSIINNNLQSNTIKSTANLGKTAVGTIVSSTKVISIAVLVVTIVIGADVSQMYNSTDKINIVDYITQTDGETAEDGSSVEVNLGLDVPEMGLSFIEKRLDVSVHIRIIDSNPVTEAEYDFEYTIGQGEKIFNFVMEDLDPNTTSKINSGETIQIEYFGNVTMVYLGMDLSPTKTDIPVGVFIVE